MAPAEDFPAALAEAAGLTDRMLARLLANEAAPGEQTRPARLIEAMRYAALGPGKRIRPFLVHATAALFGAAGEGVTRAGAALECVHAYSLVHDDLPAMDDDATRRGRPTVHVAFDEATAILAGDALLTLAFAILADPATHADAAVRGQLVAELAAAAGVGGMAGGQMLDLAAEGEAPTAESVAMLQAMKTGALFRYAAEAGALLGRASVEERERLARFGAHLGLVFQIADDLIDATGKAATAGKATAKDAARGKATFVALLGLSGAEEKRDQAITIALDLLRPFGRRAAVLAEAVHFAGRRER